MSNQYAESPEFWTEDRCIQQHAALHNVLMNPAKFPKANADRIWRDIDALEFYMLGTFATVRTMRVLTGTSAHDGRAA